jgi:hypothetical protein
MLILDYRVTYVCSRFVERRMFILDLSSDVYDETSLKLTRHFIKFIMSDSSNLTKTLHQTWWVKRHLIKSNEHVISSNFLKIKTVSLLFDEQFCSDIWYEELNLAENHFLYENKCLCEDCYDKWAFLMKVERWYNSTFSYKRRTSSYVKTMNDCRRSDNSSS